MFHFFSFSSHFIDHVLFLWWWKCLLSYLERENFIIPCHWPFWDSGILQCHVKILHNQSFQKCQALCLPIRYPEHCQEYSLPQDTLFWHTGRLPSIVFPYELIFSITTHWPAVNTSFRFKFSKFLIQLANLFKNVIVCRFHLTLKWQQNTDGLPFV